MDKLPPLPKMPSSEESKARHNYVAVGKASELPPIYRDPPVTCWTAILYNDKDTILDETVTLLSRDPNMQVSRNGYSLIITCTDFRAVAYTANKEGKYVTMFRRLNGDIVRYNNMFSYIQCSTSGSLTACLSSSSNYLVKAGL